MPNITINNLNEINLNKKSDTLVIGYFQDKPTNLNKINEISSSLINETIKSNDLSNKNSVESTKLIYKILDEEIKKYIHSIQISFSKI